MKYRFRKNGEIVEVISYSLGVDRSENDWVSYIDSKGREHHKVKGYNIHWDFEMAPCDCGMDNLKWEYKVEHILVQDEELRDALNNYGKDGWELVSTVKDTLGRLCIFKKPVMDNPTCKVSS